MLHHIQRRPVYTWPSECPLNDNMAAPTSPAAIMTQCTHLPFKPTQQHEADLCVSMRAWVCPICPFSQASSMKLTSDPLGLWFHHVPVSRVMRLTYVGFCCCVCVCECTLQISDSLQDPPTNGDTNKILLSVLTSGSIHQRLSVIMSMLLNLMVWQLKRFQSFTSHACSTVCVCVGTLIKVSLCWVI